MTKEQTRILSVVETVFVPLIRDTFGDKLQSVILYGSAVKGRFVDKASDVNALILISEDDPDALTILGKKAARIMWKNRISPLILTAAEFINSADVFPMEYMDIRSSRKVVFGSDVTEELEITKANLRHQVEEQLRGSITSLRGALLHSRGKAWDLKQFLKGWFGAQNALFRGLLRLKGAEEVPSEPEKIAVDLGEAFSVDSKALSQAIRIRHGEKLDASVAAKGLLLLLTNLVKSVDSMES